MPDGNEGYGVREDDMEIGKSFSHTIAVPSYNKGTGYVQLNFQEYYDLAGNYSTIVLTGASITHSYYSGQFYVNGTIKTADGIAIASMSGNQYSGYTGQAVTGTFPLTSGNIYHDAATGAKTVTINIVIDSLFSNSAGWVSNSSGSFTVSLTTIPRLSELSVAAGALGMEQALTVNRKSTAYTHTVTWSCGSDSGTVCEMSGSTSLGWTPPLALAAQNTTGTSVSVTFTVTTYSGSTAIGSNTKTVNYTIPADIKPTVLDGWVTAVPYNDGTKAAGIGAYVQGYSKAQVTFDAAKIDMSGCYGGEIASYKIVYQGTEVTDAPYRTGLLTAAGMYTITCYVYDTRGRFAAVELTIPVEAYANPTLTDIDLYRSNSVGEASDMGVYVSVLATANISSIGGLNTHTLQTRFAANGGSYGNYTALTSGVRSQIGGGNILTTQSYIVEILLTDRLGNTAVYTQLIATAEAFFHGRQGGKGAAFGKYGEKDNTLQLAWDLEVEGDAAVDGTLTVGGKTLDQIADPLKNMPVGYIYLSTVSTSPAAMFGGTWEQLKDRFLLAAGGVYAAGATGGAAEHTLIINEIPLHGHNLPLSGGSLGGGSALNWAAANSRQGWWDRTIPNAEIGGDAPHNNMPPYLSVYMWKRTA